jgi:phosphate-selective porin OprO and OprP
MKIKITSFLLILFFTQLKAQVHDTIFIQDNNDIRLAALPYYHFGSGVGITSPDSIFRFNIRFRMQNRMSYVKNENADPRFEAHIRRLRLRFDGFVGDPKFLYVIQLSFSPGDVGSIEEGQNINIIRDAVFIYRPNRHWNFIFGQTKLPGNRQRVNSSGALQLTDRTINNARFNIDRDFGIQAYYINENLNRFSYNLKTAISTGEGRNWTRTSDNNLAYTAKLELFPFGAFMKEGIYFEGDQMRESRPKVLLSAALSQNNNAKRTQGQLGTELYEERTFKSLLIDGMLKYKGWAFQTAFMKRDCENPITRDVVTQDSNFVFTGMGFDYQLSYIFPNNFEIIGRFSTQNAAKAIQQLAPDARQYSIGLTRYFREHAFKLQTEFTFDHLEFFDGTTRNNWYVRFQVEIGI